MRNKHILLRVLSYLVIFASTSGAEYNQKCNENRDCTVPNLICIGELCKCPEGTRYIGLATAYSSKIEASCEPVLNSKCTDNEDCIKMEGAICEHKICVCTPGFTPSQDSKKCLKVSTVGQPCDTNQQCTTTMGTDAVCNSNKCDCKEDFHVNFQTFCIRNKGFHEACESSEECYQKIDDKNVLTCTNKICSCISGYEEVGDTCSGSSRNAVASVALLSFFFYTVYFAISMSNMQ